jgi:Methyltransferase domain
MGSSLQNVHPTRRSEKVISFVGSAVMRSGANEWMRGGMLRVARPTYARTLRVIPSRLELPFLLDARRLTGTAVEVGVDEGVFSEYLLEHWHGQRLISVDPWLELPSDEYADTCNISQASMDEKYETAKRRLAPFGQRSAIWRETSIEAAGRVTPGSLDFVYLDARHSYEGVTEDLQAWFPLVRGGGLMAGHDYNDGVFVEGVHGVRSAVDQFFGVRAIPVRHTYTDVPSASWIAQIPRRQLSSLPHR